MASRDAIEMALNSPMDWETFESLVAEVLQQDDFPRLRKFGGRADRGIDAIDQAFFKDETRTEAVVQATSQKAQVKKFKSTVVRLREEEIEFRLIVLVFRHPVASTVRTEIQGISLELGVSVDIRDQSYLITQLSKVGSSLFARHFEDIGKQVQTLLAASDPLQISSDPVRHAILASIGAFVLNPHARIVRRTLFEKTVLSVIVSIGSGTINDIVAELKVLMPEEQVDESRTRPALDSLRKSNEIGFENQKYIAKTEALLSVGRIIAASSIAYEGLRDFVIEKCSRIAELDDASRGYLERNLRRASLMLLRSYGPINPEDSDLCIDEVLSYDLLHCFANDLPENVARAALISFGAYVEDRGNTSNLAAFARTYSALAIRNLDPLGRRWQQAALSRSLIALDTDAVLNIIIKELPEHAIITGAVRALKQIGLKIAVSQGVIGEAVGHISRADRSYYRFRDYLLRMPPSLVDAQVWHAVVRGFYYASDNSDGLEWRSYWTRYYDDRDPERYVRFLLNKSVSVSIEDLSDIPEEWFPDLEMIADDIHAHKETFRRKAEFRDDKQMHSRAYDDVRMAMHLATYESKIAGAGARGYIVSEDRGFLRVQRHTAWAPRPEVLLFTNALPELAAFLCGTTLDDEQLVQLLFDPIIASAATLMESEINTLTSLGVNLRTINLGRLEWDLSAELHEAVLGYQKTSPDDFEIRLNGAMGVLKEAEAADLPVDPTISHLAESYKKSVKDITEGRVEHEKLEDIIHRLALAAGRTKKARRRVNQVLKEIGLEFNDLISDD